MSELAEEGARIIADESEYREPTPSAGKKRGRPRKVKEPEPPFSYVRNEASIKACVVLSAVVMRIVCRLSKWEPLTDEEELELGHALDPVIQKRLPLLQNWGEEMGLAMVLMGVIAPRALAGPKGEMTTEEAERILRKDIGDQVIEIKPEEVQTKPEEKPEPIEKSW